MAKFALLVGISTYSSDLASLPAAVKDVEELQRVLKHPEMGNFDRVEKVLDKDVQTIRRSIEDHFLNCGRDDLALLFFSGHGIKDDFGKLYLAGPETSKDKQGNLVRSTAVETSFIQEAMTRSRSRHKVVILDCCFSGAFGEGFLAKDDGVVDIENQLGGEGIAVLTSSTSLQYSFEHEDSEASIYTRYLVEGIETGAADLDKDGLISSGELHDYTARKVSEAAPAMRPKFFGFEEGFRIYLSQAPTQDPILQYRRAVERAARLSLGTGEISTISQQTLAVLRENLGIPRHTADQITYEVLEPYRNRQQSLQSYEQALRTALVKEYPLSSKSESELKHLQGILGLQNEDIEPIHSRLLSERETSGFLSILDTSNDDKVNSVSVDEALPTLDTTLETAQRNDQEILLPASNQEENNGGKRRSFEFSLHLVALGLFVSTVAVGILAYQYLWEEPDQEEPPIAFQSIHLVPNSYEGINAIVKGRNRESKSADTRAWEFYIQGELNAAIEELETVLPGSPEYADAQDKLKIWRTEFQENQDNLELSEAALQNGDLSRAEAYARAIDGNHDYWEPQRQDLLNRIFREQEKERIQIARQSYRRVCSPSGLGVELSKFDLDSQGQLTVNANGDFIVLGTYELSEGTEVAILRAPANAQIDGLTFVEVRENPYQGQKGWVPKDFLCRLDD